VVIEGPNAAQIDDLGGNTLSLQEAGRFEHHFHHFIVGNKRHIRTGALDIRLADGNEVFTLRNLTFIAIHLFGFHENNRVVVANRRFEQPLGVIRIGGRHYF